MLKVSVVIPTYNRAKYVVKAIDSVLAQTYTDYEVIIIDDGSTDNTCEVLKPYTDRIQYIHQDNAGVSAARNTGIRAAKGKWIAFLDSDDEWLPKKLSIQMRDVQKRPDVCAHITNVTFNPPNGRPISLFEVRNFRIHGADGFIIERPFQYVLNYEIAVTSSLVVRRDILFDSGLFDTGLSIGEDVDLFLRVALQGPWAGSNIELLNYYRRKESTISLSRHPRCDQRHLYETIVYVLEKIRNSPKLSNEEQRLLNHKLSGWVFRLAMRQLQEGDKEKARKNFNRSLELDRSLKSLIKFVLTLFPSFGGLRLYEKWYLRRGPGFHMS